MGTNCSSPASWCKRSKVDNACLKSERFLNGRVSETRLIEMEPPCVLVVNVFFFLINDKCDLHLQEHPIVAKTSSSRLFSIIRARKS